MQLKVPQGVVAVLPRGPPNQRQVHEHETCEQLGNDDAGLISKIEKELCTIEGRGGAEAENSGGRRNGVAEKRNGGGHR